MKVKMKEKMKRDKDERKMIFPKCFRTLKPTRRISPECFEKNPFRTNYSSIFSKVQKLTVFSIIYMIRIRFSGPGELIQNGFSAAQYGMGENSTRSYESKDRAIQEYLETHSKYCMFVQFEVRSRERPASLPNTVTCSRSLQHTTCSLH